ncbi:hypothetical protein L2E82_05114 [Cichorium intybus]|uniref:Uncharacterized protein n=1 Tax=Cichorium intybus TaxID=13427 RepID=A0ACB9H672_CICIN|nr:hypothetical protein L2E82_05114 [Cichorium intybus]
MSKASDLETEWVEQDEPGVYISIGALPGGNCELRRVRLSREKFGEMNARMWFKTFKKSKVFADLLFDPYQILMVTVVTALTTISYEIEVHTVWKNIGVSVSIVEADKKIMIDRLNYDAIFVNSLEAKEAVSGFSKYNAAGNTSGDDYENIDWDTEDELEIRNITPSSCAGLATLNIETIVSNGEASSSAGPSNSKLVQHFLRVGLSEQLIAKAIK